MQHKSMTHYLASLIPYGHVPQRTGFCEIGRTAYCVGEFITLPRPMMPGCRAWIEGQRMTEPAIRWAMMPMYRTDWIKRHDLTVPELLPASYRRSSRTTYLSDGEQEWYVAGWDGKSEVFWLHDAEWMKDSSYEQGRPQQRITELWWSMSYEQGRRIVSPEIREQLAKLERGLK